MKILFLFFFLSVFGSFAQKSHKDSTIQTLLVGLNYKANVSGGDLADRWGFNNQLGLDVDFKFENNLTVGLNGGFIFGNNLRDSTIFDDLYDSFGTITGISGAPADVLFLLRGFTVHGSVGYVFNQLGHNANSGLWINGGVGYMAHKIRIESLLDVVPQLEGDYRKGYDKLSVGLSTKQFVGYLYQANKRLLKFYAGFEFVQGFTKNIRTYNFDSGGPEFEPRLDLNYGIKVGWILPIGPRTRSQFYYN